MAYWTSSSALGTGSLFDNGTIAGINATNSTSTLFVQGSGTLNPFAVASSSGTNLFTVTSAGNVNIATLTASNLVVTDAAKNLQSYNLAAANLVSNNLISTTSSSGVFYVSTTTNALTINFPNNLVNNTYASGTFPSFTYATGTFPIFTYATGTFPSFSYATNTFQTTLTNPVTGTGKRDHWQGGLLDIFLCLGDRLPL